MQPLTLTMQVIHPMRCNNNSSCKINVSNNLNVEKSKFISPELFGFQFSNMHSLLPGSSEFILLLSELVDRLCPLLQVPLNVDLSDYVCNLGQGHSLLSAVSSHLFLVVINMHCLMTLLLF